MAIITGNAFITVRQVGISGALKNCRWLVVFTYKPIVLLGLGNELRINEYSHSHSQIGRFRIVNFWRLGARRSLQPSYVKYQV
jgi:hypothetical protein